MTRLLLLIWRWFARIFQRPPHILAIDLITYVFATYVTLEKFQLLPDPDQISAFLEGIHVSGAQRTIARDFVTWGVVYALFAKAILIIVSRFSGNIPVDSGVARLARCFLTVKTEDEREIRALRDQRVGPTGIFDLRRQRSDVNSTSLLHTLSEQLLDCLPGLENNQLFVSLYVTMGARGPSDRVEKLRLLTHFPRYDDGEIVSPIIDLKEDRFRNYETVKCLNEDRAHVYLIDCKKYFKSNTNRHRDIKHYIGMPLKGADVVLGFLNIEISKIYFTSEKEMARFAASNVLSYRYLLEHELLREYLGEVLKAGN